jgi:hypothetical protein
VTVATVAVASCFCCCSHDHKKVVTSLCASLLQTTASPDVFPTPVHAGFGQTFSEVWPDIEAALEELVVVNMTASQASLSSAPCAVQGWRLGFQLRALISFQF